MKPRGNYRETVYVVAHPTYVPAPDSRQAQRREHAGSRLSDIAATLAVLIVAAAAIAAVTYQIIFMLELLSQVMISGGL